MVTSPNYPDYYPDNLEKTDTIQVEQGLVITLEFTAFRIQKKYKDCRFDHLTITDSDGTTLMEKRCGSSLPPAIRSRSNTINLVFTTDGSSTRTGWSISWRAVAGINHQSS